MVFMYGLLWATQKYICGGKISKQRVNSPTCDILAMLWFLEIYKIRYFQNPSQYLFLQYFEQFWLDLNNIEQFSIAEMIRIPKISLISQLEQN